jgi:hypothetical protein
MNTTEKQFILIAIKGTHHKPVFGPAIAKVVASEKKKLSCSGNWNGWIFQIRNPEAYKSVPILNQKPLTFEQKLKKLKA